MLNLGVGELNRTLTAGDPVLTTPSVMSLSPLPAGAKRRPARKGHLTLGGHAHASGCRVHHPGLIACRLCGDWRRRRLYLAAFAPQAPPTRRLRDHREYRRPSAGFDAVHPTIHHPVVLLAHAHPWYLPWLDGEGMQRDGGSA